MSEHTGKLLQALHFAAQKHRDHRRKDSDAPPYINHPIEVAEVLTRIGGIEDIDVLCAAVLHDTVEDTETTLAEIERDFGSTVCALVAEVTDDTSLVKEERKRMQVERAKHLSGGAKLVKLADKICNVRDIAHAPPAQWSTERRIGYLDWAAEVVDGCRGINGDLEQRFDEQLAEARRVVG